MFIFNEELLSESGIDSTIDVEPTNNGYDPTYTGVLEVISESMTDMYHLNAACLAVDMMEQRCVLKESLGLNIDTVDIEQLQENVFKDIWGKIKEIFSKMWAKMKEIYNNFIRFLSAKFSKGDNFFDKYKDDLDKVDASGFEYEGYNFTLDSVNLENIYSKAKAGLDKTVGQLPSGATKENAEKISKIITDTLSKTKELEQQMQGSACGKDKLDGSDFKKEIFKLLRGGKDSKEKISNPNIADLKKNVADCKTDIVIVKADLSHIDKIYRDAINIVEKRKSDCEGKKDKGSEDEKKYYANCVSFHTKYLSLVKHALTIANHAAGLKNSALKDRKSQSRDIVYKLILNTKKNKKENVSESTIFDSVMNFL